MPMGVTCNHRAPRTAPSCALHWAARNGRARACAWLRARGARVDDATRDGTTAFHWGVWQGHRRVCEWLLGAGADAHSLNAFGCNALQWAAQRGDVAMCGWLVGAEVGMDLAVVNANGHSCVHKAAMKGQVEMCEWLLGEGGLATAVHLRADADGNTPAVMARAEGHTELAEMLAQYEDIVQHDEEET